MISEETDKQLARALEGMMNTLSSGKEFVLEQSPLVCQEYVAYTMIEAIVVMAIQLVAVIALGVIILKSVKAGRKDKWEAMHNVLVVVFGTMAWALICILAVAGTGSKGIDGDAAYKRALKAKFAPRVLLLEKANEMLQGGKPRGPHSH